MLAQDGRKVEGGSVKIMSAGCCQDNHIWAGRLNVPEAAMRTKQTETV